MSLEIIGPPKAWVDYTSEDGVKHEVPYHMFGWRGKDPAKLVRQLEGVVKLAKMTSPDSVLFWRRLPELVYEEDTGEYKITCRFTIIPELNGKQWKELGERCDGEYLLPLSS